MVLFINVVKPVQNVLLIFREPDRREMTSSELLDHNITAIRKRVPDFYRVKLAFDIVLPVRFRCLGLCHIVSPFLYVVRVW